MEFTALKRRILPALLGVLLCTNITARELLTVENIDGKTLNSPSDPGEYFDESKVPIGRMDKIGTGLKSVIALNAISDPTDNEDPNAICVAPGTVTFELDEDGIAVALAEDIDAGSTDNVSISSLAVSPSTFDCNTIGTQSVTLTVTDSNGNTATCTTNVEVVDVSAPTMEADQTLDLYLDSSGNANLTSAMLAESLSENCGINSVSISPNAMDCADVNIRTPFTTHPIITEYVDGTGDNKYIEIYNGTGEPIDMQTYSLVLIKDTVLEYAASEDLGAAGILEYGEVAVFRNENATAYTGTSYVHSAVDFDGNDFLLLTSNVDVSKPKDTFGYYTGEYVSEWSNGEVSSNNHTLRRKTTVTMVNEDSSNPAFLSEWEQYPQDDLSGLGEHRQIDEGTPVNITAIDNNGNTSSMSVSVNVHDTIPPVFIDIPTDTVISVISGQYAQFNYQTPTASDNCSVTIESNIPPESQLLVGERVVTLIALDPSGNVAVHKFTVTVTPAPLQTNITGFYDSIVCYDQITYLNAHPVGGVQPYTIIWDGVDTAGFLFTTETPGLHTVKLIDDAGETAYDTITLFQNPEILFQESQINPTCATCYDGSISMGTIGGGTPPLETYFRKSYTGEVYPNVITVNNLDTGIYIGVIKDTIGCYAIEEFNLVVEPDTAPTALCGTTTLALEADGTAILEPIDLDGGSSDNNATLNFTASQTTFDCSHLGENEITLTVTDINGNSSTCNGMVTVVDTLPPVPLLSDTVYVNIDGSSQYEIEAGEGDNGSYDNCGISNYTVSPQFLTCENVVTDPTVSSDLIISEYVDGSGNNKYIEIYNGTGAPVELSNYELRLYADGASSPTATNNLYESGVLANGSTVVFANLNATIFNGNNSVIFTVNFDGNDAIALFNISTNQIIDVFGVIGEDPGSAWEDNGLSTKDHTLRRKPSISAGFTNPTSADFLSEWEQADQDDVSGLGTHSFSYTGGTEITATLTDNSGNISTDTFIAIPMDEVAPIFTSFQEDILINADTATCSAVATWPEPEVFDNCSLTLTGNFESGDTFPLGQTEVTYTATDPSGNSATLSFFVVVIPKELSVVVPYEQTLLCHDTPSMISANVSGGCGPYTLSWDGVASAGYSALLEPGLHEVVVTDANGINANMIFNLVNLPPIEMSFDTTQPNCGSPTGGEIAVSLSGGIAPYSIAWSGDATGSENTLSNIGSGTYTITVTDSKGCSAVESVTLDGSDLTPPTAFCVSTTLYLDENGEATLNASTIDGGSTDNCGEVSISASQTAFDCENIGENQVTLTVTDEAGLTTTCTALVSVTDTINPVIDAMPASITATADSSTCAAIVSWTEPSATDICGKSLTANYAPGDSFPIGETVVTYTATDPSGNETSESFTITVSPEELVLGLHSDRYIHCHGGTVDLVAYATGGCAPYQFSWDGVLGTDTNTTATGEHTLSVTDANGTTTSTNFYAYEPDALQLTFDVTNPQCGSDATGEITATIDGGTQPYSIAWSGDATGTGNTLSNLANGVYFATVTDAEGCSITDSIALEGTDLTPPTAFCVSTTLYLDENGETTLEASAIDGGSNDNCGDVSISASPNQFDCTAIGENSVTLTVTDEAGLTTSCTALVTVVDTVAPEVQTQDIQVILNSLGLASIDAYYVDAGTTDNCELSSLDITSGQTEYVCEDSGEEFTVTLTATDIYGNTSTGTAQVSVMPSIDEDDDGIDDACDICYGDNSYGDANGDGICDESKSCPNAKDILDPDLPCDYQISAPTGLFNAGSGGVYCFSGPFNGGVINATNGSKIRLSGVGTISVQLSANSSLQVMEGSTINFNTLYMGWNSDGLVVNPNANISLDSFNPSEPVVNCGTIVTRTFGLAYNGVFLNNGVLKVGDPRSTSNIQGTFINNGTMNLNGSLYLLYTGRFSNYCTVYIGKDFIVSRFVKNYGFIDVTDETNITYTGSISLYDGAMHRTGQTEFSGRYTGFGTSSLVEVETTTTANWTGRITGELYFCDIDGIESAPNYSNLFEGNAQESCALSIPVSECNPIGNSATPSGMAMGDTDNTDWIGVGDPNGIPTNHQTRRQDNAVRIFPNPTKGRAIIHFTPSSDKGVTIGVYNVRGKQLEVIKPAGQIAQQPFSANLDLSAYQNGVYFIRITDDNRTATKKLVITK